MNNFEVIDNKLCMNFLSEDINKENVIDLSIEKWDTIYKFFLLNKGGSFWGHNGSTCSLCIFFDECSLCPLAEFDKPCDDPGSLFNNFKHKKNSENAKRILHALIEVKGKNVSLWRIKNLFKR